MPRVGRGQTGGICIHVINRGNGKARVFHDEDDYAVFVELLGRGCERIPIRVVSCCLMPNHIHLILWPREDGDLSAWIQWVTTSHVRRHHRRYGTSGHVWQGRFKSFPVQHRQPSASQRARGVVETGDPVLQVARSVERNPLRAGLVTLAERWPWSSLHWWSTPAAAPGFWQPDVIWRPEDWLALVNRPETDEELVALRQSVQRGTPFGSEAWRKQVVDE